MGSVDEHKIVVPRYILQVFFRHITRPSEGITAFTHEYWSRQETFAK